MSYCAPVSHTGLDEALELFRSNEDLESVLILLGETVMAQGLRRVALAWPKLGVHLPDRQTEIAMHDDPAIIWEQLWTHMEIDYVRLGRVSETWRDAERYVETLKTYRLIYPDGTLAMSAQKALRTVAMRELGVKRQEKQR